MRTPEYLKWVKAMTEDRGMLSIWNGKLRELNSKLNNYQASLDKMFKIKTKYPYNDSVWNLKSMYGRLFMVMIGQRQKEIKKLESEIRRFVWLKNKALGKEGSGLDIEKARNYPITELLPMEPTGKSCGRIYYLCPIVTEKTGSFVVYKEQNTFHCFSCGKGTSVIDLFMELNHCAFVEAVRALQNY